jgi:hypothetical protein
MVRYEPLALLIPDGHPLVVLPEVPCDSLRGMEIDASAGNEDAPEWVDLAVSLLEAFGGRASGRTHTSSARMRPRDTCNRMASRSSP